MRRLNLMLALVALVGCGDRRSFDEHYSDTEQNIEQRAHDLDARMNAVDANIGGNGEPENRARP